MIERKERILKLVVVVCVVLLLLSGSLNACSSLPSSANSRPAAEDGVVVTLTWDEWQDLTNCVSFVTSDIGFTLDVAKGHLDANTTAEASATVNRLTQLGAKLDQAAQESSVGMSDSGLEAILDAQLGRTRQFTDLMTRLFDARMNALVNP